MHSRLSYLKRLLRRTPHQLAVFARRSTVWWHLRWRRKRSSTYLPSRLGIVADHFFRIFLISAGTTVMMIEQYYYICWQDHFFQAFSSPHQQRLPLLSKI